MESRNAVSPASTPKRRPHRRRHCRTIRVPRSDERWRPPPERAGCITSSAARSAMSWRSAFGCSRISRRRFPRSLAGKPLTAFRVEQVRFPGSGRSMMRSPRFGDRRASVRAVSRACPPATSEEQKTYASAPSSSTTSTRAEMPSAATSSAPAEGRARRSPAPRVPRRPGSATAGVPRSTTRSCRAAPCRGSSRVSR